MLQPKKQRLNKHNMVGLLLGGPAISDRVKHMPEDRIIVGSIGGAFGVSGDVRLKSFCADPQAIADYTPLTTDKGRIFATIVVLSQTKGSLIARLDGITTKEQADALRGVDLFADRAQLPHLPDDEYYHNDLVGLAVFDAGGAEIGRVKAVMNNGAEDMLEVTGAGLRDSALIPFTRKIVPTVDLASGRVIIDPPEGLMPDSVDPADG